MSHRQRARASSSGVIVAFPFDKEELVNRMLRDFKGLRHVTCAQEVLRSIVHQGEAYMAASQCSLNKGLEKICLALKQAFGESIHEGYWRIVRFLCDGRRTQGAGTGGFRPPYPTFACMATGLVRTAGSRPDDLVLVPSLERWEASSRGQIPLHLEMADQRRVMNFQIVEAVYHHQMENSHVWERVPDLHAVFLALAFARRGAPSQFSAEMGSYYASLALHYEVHNKSALDNSLKGLRRWRNVVVDKMAEVSLEALMWGHRQTPRNRASPRHHQLWHYERLINEMGLAQMQSTVRDGKFLLLLAVIQDHVFARIPPEDAAEAVVAGLFKPHGQQPTSKQRFDIARIAQALKHPRSPYLFLLFREQYNVTVEAWLAKLGC